MDITTSYPGRVHSEYSAMNNMFDQTCAIYTDAVRFLCDVVNTEWDKIGGSTTYDLINVMEDLTHITKNNPKPKYGFDAQFPNFPSYLRREAIKSAHGKVSSYKSNLANWLQTDQKTKEPSFPTVGYEMPSLYFGNMFKFTDEKWNPIADGSLSNYAMVKVYCSQRQLIQDHAYSKQTRKAVANGTLDPNKMVWDWVKVRIKPSDIRYLDDIRHNGGTIQPPFLVRDGKQFILRFPAKRTSTLPDRKVWDRLILAVDLGINTPATCCVMDSRGTILARRFFAPVKDMGCLDHRLAEIRRAQSMGSRKMPFKWRMVNNANEKLSRETAAFIITTAMEFAMDTIVFESLQLKGKKHGSRKWRLHHWRAKYVQELVECKAHILGMRISRVSAWNTSRLAFDGSGRVKRGKQSDKTKGNYSLCEFKNGKVYNCDLSASYNIGARYFIREIEKAMTETAWSELVAKVPELSKRSTCTLSSLISLCAVLASNDVRMPHAKTPSGAAA